MFRKTSHKSRSHKSRLKSRLAILSILGVSGAALPWALEELPLLINPPSPEIVRLSTATTMTPEAQKLFYRQQPKIQSKAAFAHSCSKVQHGSKEIVALGCYQAISRSGQVISGEIFIQSILDPRFSGIMEATAAHEMLHAAYVRLSDSERAKIAPKLEQSVYLVKDKRLVNLLKRYKQQDRELYRNELHSHLGTEVANLGNPELESYYSRYFTNRLQVVAFAERSQTAFRQLDTKIETLETKLNALEANLKASKQNLIASQQYLKAGQQDLKALKTVLMNIKAQAELSSGTTFSQLAQQFESSKATFNNRVNNYNYRVRQHQREVDAFNQQVDVYKKTIAEYNAIAKEERSLLDELKATPQEWVTSNE